MRALAVLAVVGLLSSACVGPSPPTPEPAAFFLRVQDIDGPPVVVNINGVVLARTTCGDPRDLTFLPGKGDAPDLPWSVSVEATDGTQLASATLDGSESHTLDVLRDGTYLDGPTANPGIGALHGPCPSLYFASPR